MTRPGGVPISNFINMMSFGGSSLRAAMSRPMGFQMADSFMDRFRSTPSESGQRFGLGDVMKLMEQMDANGNGRTTRGELNRHIEGLENKLDMLDSHCCPCSEAMKNSLERELEAAKFMEQNFDSIAGQDGKRHSISLEDVLQMAGLDGNPNDITSEDAAQAEAGHNCSEGAESEGPPEGAAPFGTGDLMSLIDEIDKNGDGKVSRSELQEFIDKNEELMSALDGFDSPALEEFKQDVEKSLDAAKMLEENFGSIARQDGETGFSPTIGADDIAELAGHDGDYNNVSREDIQGSRREGAFETNELMELVEAADKNGDGRVTRNELRDHIARLEELQGMLHEEGGEMANCACSEIQRQLDGANVLANNFFDIASQGGGGMMDNFTISSGDIMNLAGGDGNYNNFSPLDLWVASPPSQPLQWG